MDSVLVNSCATAADGIAAASAATRTPRETLGIGVVLVPLPADIDLGHARPAPPAARSEQGDDRDYRDDEDDLVRRHSAASSNCLPARSAMRRSISGRKWRTRPWI